MNSGAAGNVCGTSVADKQMIRTHLNMWGEAAHDIKKQNGPEGGYFSPEFAQMQRLS